MKGTGISNIIINHYAGTASTQSSAVVCNNSKEGPRSKTCLGERLRLGKVPFNIKKE